MRTKRSLYKILIFSMALGGIFNAIDYYFTAISAYASTSGIEMSATINPSSTITISANNVALDITPSVEGTFSSDYATVSTYTNTANNCTITMTTNSTNLTSGNNIIATLPGSVSEANFTNDRWGYRVGTSGDYNAVGASNQIATYAQNTGSSSALNLAVYFAAKLTPATKPGTYTDTVTFISTCAPDPVPANINDLEYMQDFATLTDSEMTELLDSMVLNQQYQLKDNRDEKEYYIAKLADGNVWMTQNLDHDIVTTENFYTSANTDINHSVYAKWTASAATHATDDITWTGSKVAPESYDPGDLCWNGVFGGYNTSTCGDNKHMHIGNYYNWTAAVAMNSSRLYYTNNTDVDQSICPAGWRLPKYADFASLGANLSLTGGASGNVQNAPVYLVYGGNWNGSSYAVSELGYYWFPVTMDTNNAMALYLGNLSSSYSDRSNGHSVRCVARSIEVDLEEVNSIPGLTYMQDFASLTSYEKSEIMNSMVLNRQYELKDNRDNKAYTIAKLADGNVWMTQDLDHDIVTTENFYTYDNTDIGHGSTPNTNAKWTARAATHATDDTTWTGSNSTLESYDPGALCWNGTVYAGAASTATSTTTWCNNRHMYIGNYYNWTAAVAMNFSGSFDARLTDVDQSICPAGWRLPTYSGNKSFDKLETDLNLSAGISGNIQNTPTYLVYGGYWNGSLSGAGRNGYYWSSVVEDHMGAYEIYFYADDGGVRTQYSGGRDYGRLVRCVVR